MLNAYLDGGGNYIETAASYDDGEFEIKIAKELKNIDYKLDRKYAKIFE